LLLILDYALLFLDLASDGGSCLGNLALTSLFRLLLGYLFIKLDTALSFLIQTLHVFELLLFASIILLNL